MISMPRTSGTRRSARTSSDGMTPPASVEDTAVSCSNIDHCPGHFHSGTPHNTVTAAHTVPQTRSRLQAMTRPQPPTLTTMSSSLWAQTAIEFTVSTVLFLSLTGMCHTRKSLISVALVSPQLTAAHLNWLQSGVVFQLQRRQRVRVRVSCRQAAHRERRLEHQVLMAAFLSLPRSTKPQRCSRVSGYARLVAASCVTPYPAATCRSKTKRPH